MHGIDFSSSLYLGFEHGSDELAPWKRLTLGRPVALREFDAARLVAGQLAALTGSAAGCLLPSTLHLFWDLLGFLSRQTAIEILMDAASYPILHWCAEHWASRGVPLRRFAAGDDAALGRALACVARRARPVVLCDGFVPCAERQPPLARYAALAAARGGWLVLDDTQALGVRGRRAGSAAGDGSAAAPYGRGGGGSLPYHDLAGDHVVVGASLAKAFGVPVALLAGSVPLVEAFEAASATREHTSPPSIAVVRAAQHALELNDRVGEARRQRLWHLVRRLRARSAAIGRPLRGGDFPVQCLPMAAGEDVRLIHRRLRERGVFVVPTRPRFSADDERRARLALVVNATHRAADIDRAVEAIDGVLSSAPRRAPMEAAP
ncbi:MAG: aminotransferase class I/II-fold pyridoxal phosphate-dependent enzyme [Piscinibacter sp.]|nr:aminotransferase class I/II-fold pyridoxal phosphate-dependent enzyme [Piscinibacter sp.]